MSAEPSFEILRLGRDRALCFQQLKPDKLSLPNILSKHSLNQIDSQRTLLCRHDSSSSSAEQSGHLPTGLSHSRNAALIGKFPETNTADAELPVNGTRPTAQHATLHLAGGELRRPLGSGDL